MKTKLQTLALMCAIICLPACSQVDGSIELVSNRNPDGTFKAVSEVTNSAGETPNASATLYHYPSGKFGVSGWYGDSVKGAPKLSKSQLP